MKSRHAGERRALYGHCLRRRNPGERLDLKQTMLDRSSRWPGGALAGVMPKRRCSWLPDAMREWKNERNQESWIEDYLYAISDPANTKFNAGWERGAVSGTALDAPNPPTITVQCTAYPAGRMVAQTETPKVARGAGLASPGREGTRRGFRDEKTRQAASQVV